MIVFVVLALFVNNCLYISLVKHFTLSALSFGDESDSVALSIVKRRKCQKDCLSKSEIDESWRRNLLEV